MGLLVCDGWAVAKLAFERERLVVFGVGGVGIHSRQASVVTARASSSESGLNDQSLAEANLGEVFAPRLRCDRNLAVVGRRERPVEQVEKRRCGAQRPFWSCRSSPAALNRVHEGCHVSPSLTRLVHLCLREKSMQQLGKQLPAAPRTLTCRVAFPDARCEGARILQLATGPLPGLEFRAFGGSAQTDRARRGGG